jgi:hypothetical protein
MSGLPSALRHITRTHRITHESVILSEDSRSFTRESQPKDLPPSSPYVHSRHLPPATSSARLYFAAKAASANGSIIAYPAAFGCTPSKLIPGFIPPSLSAIAVQ